MLRWCNCERYSHDRVGSARATRYTTHMGEVVRRMFTFSIAACAVAYVVYFLAGASIYAQAEAKQKTVWVRDQISPSAHHISGLVTVKNSCTELTEKAEQLSPLLYRLTFTTWEHPNTECTDYPVQKQFYDIIFAPAVGVHFIATLDGRSLPLIVVPYIP